MEFLKSLWKPRGSTTIPQYGPDDSADILVKSLVYMFKRLDLSEAKDSVTRHDVEGMTKEEMLRLDQMYNIEQFERKLQDDPHRVLVDWQKNKFRAMLILAHMPQIESLPKFDIPNLRFAVLESDASNDEYIRTLSTSDIYVEHNLPIQVRREIAATCLRKYRDRNLQTRDQIITDYLRLVATEIQVARIYKAMLNKSQPPSQSTPAATSGIPNQPKGTPSRFPARSRSPSPARGKNARPDLPSGKLGSTPSLATSNQSSPLHSPKHSPQGSPRLSPQQAGSNQEPGSSPKLKKQTSSNFRMAPTPNLGAPRTGVAPSAEANKKYVLQQARLAVKSRIEKEQRIMNEHT